MVEKPDDAERILNRLARWMEETRGHTDALEMSAVDESVAVEPIGTLQLAEHLTSMRHEVKLLTKAVRGTEERGEAALLAVQAAIEQLRLAKPDGFESSDATARAMVEVLADLDDSLERGRRAIESARKRALQEAALELEQLRGTFDELYRLQPWWRRALCRPWHRALQNIHSGQSLASLRNVFDSLLEGYNLIQNRLQRSFRELQVLRIDCVGRPVDPHCMTVLEAVSDSSRPSGIVLEEVRAGYYWKGKVLRFAEVKAVAAH